MSDSCMKCGAHGVRLYRPYGEFFRPTRIRCAPCARAASPNRSDKDSVTEIGWFVPLIRCETGEPWGYTSVPEADLAAWMELPEVMS